MKTILKYALSACFLMSVMTSCVERRYYRDHHQHSPRYVQRHPGVGVGIEYHN